MLSNAPVSATLPAVDLQRARRFYEGKLGLLAGKVTDESITFKCGTGMSINVYLRGEATKAEHTAATFTVEHLENEMKQLRASGVVFEEYDFPGLKTVNGIAARDGEKAAWFKDTEGNILCLHQEIK